MTFNKTIATIMGNAESATILDNIYFWVDKNKANEKHTTEYQEYVILYLR